MASPQLENGHTRIANELLEQLMKWHLSPNQWRVLLCIIRKTYGFQKKVDYIANFQIVEATGLCKAVVSRCMKELQLAGIITRQGKQVGFQKDWEDWRKLAVSSTGEKLAVPSTELAVSSTKISSPATTQKKKETIQNKLIKRKYGQFQNVLLTNEEYQKLQVEFNTRTAAVIEELSLGIESKGYKYKSHYAAILNWQRRTRGKGRSRELPKDYTPQREY